MSNKTCYSWPRLFTKTSTQSSNCKFWNLAVESLLLWASLVMVLLFSFCSVAVLTENNILEHQKYLARFLYDTWQTESSLQRLLLHSSHREWTSYSLHLEDFHLSSHPMPLPSLGHHHHLLHLPFYFDYLCTMTWLNPRALAFLSWNLFMISIPSSQLPRCT